MFRTLGILYIFLIFSLINPLSSEAVEQSINPSKELRKLSLDELMDIEVTTVYGASKHLQKVTEAPSSVTIITADEIRKYGYRTLADILKSVKGFYVTYDRNYSYIGVRGFGRSGDYDSRILILVDGHRINDNVYDAVLIGTEFILDVDLIDRVEVIRGPGSSLYGSNALFGIINILTRRATDFKGSEISGEAASFDTYKGRLSYGNKFTNDMELVLSGSLYDSNGQDLFFKEFDYSATNDGIAKNCDYERNFSLFSKFSYRGFNLEGAFVSRTKGVPTASFGTVFNDPRTQTTDAQGYINLNYSYEFDKESKAQASLYYDRFYYHGNYIYDYPPVTLNKDLSSGTLVGGELKFSTHLFEKHNVTLGMEYRNNIKQEQENYDTKPYYLYLDDNRHSTVWALYIQDEFAILKNLLLNAGVRYDHYETSGGATNPRFALIYNPLPKTVLKLLYGEAFRTPNAYELYYQDGGISEKSNPDLEPETIKTYEMVLEQYVGNHILISVSGFYYKINDLIIQKVDPTDGLLIFKNQEDIRAKGIEMEITGKWENGIEGSISYTFQEAENQDTETVLVNSPKHLAKLNIILPMIQEKLFVGMEEQFMSKRTTLKDKHTDSFFITNLTLFSQKVLKGLAVSGSIYNLFNKKYSDPGGVENIQDAIEQDGTSFRFKLTYNFEI